MSRFLGNVLVGALIILLTASAASAQLSTAELSGRVTDTSGAVLPGVTVTMTQTDTQATRTAITDADGTYVISNLPTGPYRLEVSLQGFRSYVQNGIVLQVGATPTINVSLELGNVAETITVEGAAPLIDVKSSGIKDVVENERIVELPLQGRQVTDLIVLAGGAVNTGSPNSRNFGGCSDCGGKAVNIAVAGGLNFGVAYLLDGAIHNDPQNNANLPLPFPDALQEFSVATSGLSAQNGMHSGASVNAVTKSGTNSFHGNAFEFNRDHAFNATNPFAAIDRTTGKRRDDGLLRNQFGGTVGGPVVRNKLFFFGAYQGTATRQTPSANIAFVPTPAMMAGDFAAFASPACNGGRQVTLRAPFVNNQISPAAFSPAAVNLAKRLPQTTDPCGQVTYGTKDDNNEGQFVGRGDYQLSTNHQMFGRYMATFFHQEAAFAKDPTNVLVTNDPGTNNLAQSFTFGDTMVLSSNTVNSLRVAFNRTSVHRYQAPFFSPKDLGSNVYDYNPGEMVLTVTGGFNISAGTATKGIFHTNTYQLNEDFSTVKGAHQLSIGADLAYWKYAGESHARSGGNWTISGQITGAGLADFLLGRVTTLEHGGPAIIPVDQKYLGFYAQDTWRARPRVTINGGLRWEPYFGQQVENGALSIFSMENFQKAVKSTVYHNAPAGFLWPGDPGFPKGNTGLYPQWSNLSPRIGVAWDVKGDGSLAIRTSYGIAYDFPSADYHNINASAPPFGNRSLLQDPPGLFDDPYKTYGGDPHPIATNADTKFVNYGSYGVVDPHINSPRAQSWNATVEKQLGSVWGVSASYLGSHTDRLWGQVALNPGEFLGNGACTINGVAYPNCTVPANLDQRRVLHDPLIGVLDLHTDVGVQNYKGMKLSVRRRESHGLSLNANYTLSKCVGNTATGTFPQLSTGYVKPNDPSYDYGHCTQDRTHIGIITVGYATPQFGSRAMRVAFSNWRWSGIFNGTSGAWLNITTGQDNSGNGLNAQRPNQVSDDVYGVKTLQAYLNKAAFAQPAPGTFGNTPINSVKGPGQWVINLALSRNINLTSSQTVELRLESFNLLNHFNWGIPATNLNLGTFGRITT
ncbi:MAG: hypothetical protein DMF88_23750, partial [Acidobacteria bacterium]